LEKSQFPRKTKLPFSGTVNKFSFYDNCENVIVKSIARRAVIHLNQPPIAIKLA